MLSPFLKILPPNTVFCLRVLFLLSAGGVRETGLGFKPVPTQSSTPAWRDSLAGEPLIAPISPFHTDRTQPGLDTPITKYGEKILPNIKLCDICTLL